MHVLFDVNDRAINIVQPSPFVKHTTPPSSELLHKYHAAYYRHVTHCTKEEYESAVRNGGHELVESLCPKT